MTDKLTNKALELLGRPVLGSVATVSSKGAPQLTPVWVDTKDGLIRFNTAVGRAKHRNLVANPSIAICVVDPNDPYNVVVANGTAEMTEEGADEHIDSLAKKYLGVDTYPLRAEGEVRVTVTINQPNIVMQSS